MDCHDFNDIQGAQVMKPDKWWNSPDFYLAQSSGPIFLFV